jgi:predicted  nucleic acid-binding Zn ribbon protein
MTAKERNDFFYVCSLIEYIARETKNKRGVIVKALGKDGIEKQLYDAEVNHCLSFEQVCDEVVEQYQIAKGDFDTITGCKYTIPSYQDIGKLYSIMIEDCAEPGKEVEELIHIFTSFISDGISNFQSDLYYQNPNYLECSYKAGYLLD